MTSRLIRKCACFSALVFIPARAFGLTAPSGFLGTPSSTNAILWNWNDDNNDESGYRVVDGQNHPVSPDLAPNTTFYMENGLDSNSAYTRKIVAFGSGVEGATGASKVFTHTHVPSDLLATSKSMNSITFVWSSPDYAKPSTRYGIERSTDLAGPYVELVGLQSNYTSAMYADAGLSPNTSYYYRMSGFNGDGIRNGPGVSMSIRTASPLPAGIAGLHGSSPSDRTVTLDWSPVSDPAASGIRIVRTGPSDTKNSFDLPVSASSFTDTSFSQTEPSFPAFEYVVNMRNSDGNFGLNPSTVTVIPLIQFQYADTDGDGKLESWDVANSTYADSSKPLETGNRLVQSLLIGNTRVLLLDVYRKSAVPVPMDFDGLPDVAWQPFAGIVNVPILGDFDGDGLKDLGLDLDNDGKVDGALTSGAFRFFGTVTVLVKDSNENTVPNAKVFLAMGNSSMVGETDFSGSAKFKLEPAEDRTGTVRVKSHGFIDVSKTVEIDQWGENNVSVLLAASSPAGDALDANNYPNPAAAGETVHVDYHTLAAGNARLDLYDIHFRLVRTILNEWKESGPNHVSFEAEDGSGNGLEKGLYFAVLTSGGEKKTLKVIVR